MRHDVRSYTIIANIERDQQLWVLAGLVRMIGEIFQTTKSYNSNSS